MFVAVIDAAVATYRALDIAFSWSLKLGGIRHASLAAHSTQPYR